MPKSIKDFLITDSSNQNNKKSTKRSRSSPEVSDEKIKIRKGTVKKLVSEMESDLEVGKMSMSKLLAEFSAMIDAKGLARKEDLNELKSCISELQEENKHLKIAVEDLQKKNCLLENRLELLENDNRKKNLIFKGMVETNNDEQNVVSKFCKDVLGVAVSPQDITDVFKINTGSMGKHLLKVSFNQLKTVRDLLKSTQKLKGTGFSIDRDYSYAVRIRRNELLKYRKDELRKDNSKRIILKKDILFIEGKKYIWDEQEKNVKELIQEEAHPARASCEREVSSFTVAGSNSQQQPCVVINNKIKK